VGLVAGLRQVVKVHGQGRAALRVLDGLDLEVRAGELVAVTGRSGSGKSTLLNIVGGLDRADSGVVEVCGVRLDGARERSLAPLRRDHIGFVFQAFHLLP
jgi:ABC-type lipoprotein export system ATPase subunit